MDTGCSPAPTRSSPGSSILCRNPILEEEFATPLNKKSPDSNLQEEMQPLPDTISKQSGDSRLADEAHYLVPYPAKPEESHCNSNMTSVTGDQEAEVAGEEVSRSAYEDLST